MPPPRILPCAGAMSPMRQPRPPCIPCLRRIPEHTSGPAVAAECRRTHIGFVCRNQVTELPATDDAKA